MDWPDAHAEILVLVRLSEIDFGEVDPCPVCGAIVYVPRCDVVVCVFAQGDDFRLAAVHAQGRVVGVVKDVLDSPRQAQGESFLGGSDHDHGEVVYVEQRVQGRAIAFAAPASALSWWRVHGLWWAHATWVRHFVLQVEHLARAAVSWFWLCSVAVPLL